MDRLIFAYCSCVQPERASINVLRQKSFDGELVHFEMQCLYCDKISAIVEDIEGCESLHIFEKEVMDWLNKDESWILLELVLTGKTTTIPREWKPKGEEHENHDIL